jgi:hypothetical protein
MKAAALAYAGFIVSMPWEGVHATDPTDSYAPLGGSARHGLLSDLGRNCIGS